MPIYIFEHPTTQERKEILQKMDDEHSYTDQAGIKWNRVFESPNASVESISSVDPFSMNDWTKKSAKKGMTVGDMWDESSRLSDKRAKTLGYDPVKKEAAEKYKKLTGKTHPHENII